MASQVYFKNIKKELIKELKSCTYCLDIAVAWITDVEIINCLEDCLKNNIQIRLISYDDKINSPITFKKLYNGGAEIRLSKKMMHHKFCIIDESILITGSFNWTKRASFNDENITIVKNESKTISSFQKEFESIWSSCPNIESKLIVSRKGLASLQPEFNDFVYEIRNTASIPYFFNVKEELLDRKNHINIPKGYYLINNSEEETKFLELIFYSRKKINMLELRGLLGYKLESKFQHFNSILHYDSNSEVIKITKSIWAEFYFKLFKISPEGIPIEQEIKYVDKIGSKYLVQDRYLKLLNEYGDLLDFQFTQRLTARDKTKPPLDYGSEIINENFFAAFVAIHEGVGAKRYGIYKTSGEVISPAYFSKVTSKNEDETILREYPVAYYNPGDNLINYCGVYDYFVYKEWVLDHKTGIVKPGKIDSFNTWKNSGKMHYDEKTQLKFYSDEMGAIYMASFLLDLRIKYEDEKHIITRFKYGTSKLTQQNSILYEAITLLKEYQKKYDMEKKIKRDIEEKYRNHKSSDKCFIATLVYGDINHKHTIELREFRDNYLSKIMLGKLIIKLYYRISPSIVRYSRDKPKLIIILRYMIDSVRNFIKMLNFD